MLNSIVKGLWNRIVALFFIVLLKGTAQMMKNDIYSLFVTHLIPKSSHFLYFELWRYYCSLTRNNGKKIWYIGDFLIKFNETWHN